MKTLQIDERMLQVGERAGQAAYEKFKQEGIALWHKKRAEEQERDGRPQTADGSREPATASPVDGNVRYSAL